MLLTPLTFKLINMMKKIIENDFIRIDLNLLTVFLVLYREASVTRTAEVLHLGQPAISGALKRLREMFNDPLFVRGAKGMLPTPRRRADGPYAAADGEPAQRDVWRAGVFTRHGKAHFMAIKRHGRAEEVAGMVAWLAGPEASFVTGAMHTIDGAFGA